MAIAGTLAVNVVANTAKFAKGIATAREKLSTFGRTVKTVGKGVLGFGSALTGLAIGGGLAVFANKTIQTIDRLNKLSEQTGISANTLQAWGHAAELGGSNLEAMTMGFKRFQRVIVDANSGLSTAQRSLGRLGLSAGELLRMKPAEQMEALSDALKSMANPTERTATAMEILGRSGAELLPTLLGNIRQIRKEMGQWGMDLTDNQISQFVDSLTQLRAEIGAAGGNFLIGITPMALEAVKGLRVIMDNIGLTQEGTAKAEMIKQRGGMRGLFGALESGRQGIIKGLGEVIGAAGTDTDITNRRAISAHQARLQGHERISAILNQPGGAGSREAIRLGQQQVRNQEKAQMIFEEMVKALRNPQTAAQVRLEPATFQ